MKSDKYQIEHGKGVGLKVHSRYLAVNFLP